MKRVGVVVLMVFTVAVTVAATWKLGFGWDSHAYWVAWHRPRMYGGGPATRDAFLYPPPFAQVIWPVAQLPWPAFAAVWATMITGLFAWLLWPLPTRRRLVAFVLVAPEVINGNLWAPFACVLVLGFSTPALWAFPLLTKVTSAVGVVWFALRREWRNLAAVTAAAAAVTIASVAASPHLWSAWLTLERSHHSIWTGRFIPFAVRLPVALMLVAVAAIRDRPRWLPWALALASPVFALVNLTVLACLPRLSRREGFPSFAPQFIEPPEPSVELRADCLKRVAGERAPTNLAPIEL